MARFPGSDPVSRVISEEISLAWRRPRGRQPVTWLQRIYSHWWDQQVGRMHGTPLRAIHHRPPQNPASKPQLHAIHSSTFHAMITIPLNSGVSCTVALSCLPHGPKKILYQGNIVKPYQWYHSH